MLYLSIMFFQVQRECYEKYGPLFRLWIGPFAFVFLAGHEQVQPVLSSSVHIEKSYEYRCLKSWLATGLLTSGGKKWHSRRKLLTGAFHTSLLESYIDSLSRGAEELVSKINGHLSKNNPVDWSEDINVVPIIKLVALDAICETIMGFNMKALEGGKNSEYVEAIHKATAILQFRFISPWLRSDIVFNTSSYGKEYNKNVAVIQKFTQKVIKERKEEMKASEENKSPKSGKARKSFLDLLLDLSENGNMLSDEDIREEVDTFMFAGHDTTSAAISFALFALGNHPEVQEKIVNEAEEMLAGMDPEKLTVAQLGKFEYLDCVVKECLRVYPSVPIVARELQSPLTICGHTFPAQTCLLISTFLLHRDPAFFPNPDMFDPDRFKNSENRNRNPFAYTPFSAGSRNCIGKNTSFI
ncbi:hypothetical protein J437_LFUL002107 [Ladona fulva]|uniref:Cytochrome P450 n=1 Tax=Ladona fulva TaxID=123851 RepID=A0A8K0NU84_LADFU|nr:hypothetical protein J437_LFUL002107 [Ladona fulva]